MEVQCIHTHHYRTNFTEWSEEAQWFALSQIDRILGDFVYCGFINGATKSSNI